MAFGELEVLTVAMIAGIISVKFVSKLYEELYEPFVHKIIPDEKCLQTCHIGNVPIKYGLLMREFIKWSLLIIVLIVIHKCIRNNSK